MGRCRVVSVETERVPLSDGDWVVLKKQLNVGEHRQILKAAQTIRDGHEPTLDYLAYRFHTVLAYIAAWSLSDATGEILPITPTGLDLVDMETYDELREAVEAHESASADTKKKTLTGKSAPDPIGPSRFAVASGSTTSEPSPSMTMRS